MRQTLSTVGPSRHKRPKLSFRAFYITVLLISAFALISFVADKTARYKYGPQYVSRQRQAFELETNGAGRLFKRDEECRLVHHADNKCAFIKANCPDEEAGLISYLSLYYCSLPNTQPVAFIILTLWLALLFSTIGIAASDFFCINLSTIASILGMSESMAGVTFLAFGNGSPDVFSTFAAISSHSGSLAVGELIGAAGFITAVVAGSMALVREFKVGKKTFVRDVGFFIVAASFSMGFLADGELRLWECSVMIGFYVFYVVIVVAWHWYLSQRRARRERDAAARGHYLSMTNEEIEVAEEDLDDEDAPAGQRRYRDTEDFEALEAGPSPSFGSQVDSDEEGNERRNVAAEMASSMRVTRPRGSRRNTITPIRPSLVGALEFRSVLSSLQKTRASHAHQIHLRRYSDDPTAVLSVRNYDQSVSDPEPYYDQSVSDFEPDADNESNIIVTQPNGDESHATSRPPVRTRAVSMNDAESSKPINPAAFSVANIPNIGIISATPIFPQEQDSTGLSTVPESNSLVAPLSPTISVSPPPSLSISREVSPAPSRESRTHDSLAPPEDGFPGARHLRTDLIKEVQSRGNLGENSTRSRSRDLQRPRLKIPSSSRGSSHSRVLSPILQFPAYTDSPLPMSSVSSKAPSLLLPETGLTPQSIYTNQGIQFQEKPIKWWPYRFLPSPYVMCSALFPTLCTWRDKSIWNKFVSIISAPSIFLLAITLPVVESESRENDSDEHVTDERAPLMRSRSTVPALRADDPTLETEPEWLQYRQATDNHQAPYSPLHTGLTGHSAALVAVSAENLHGHPYSLPVPIKRNSLDLVGETSSEPPTPSPAPGDWNRWLVTIQIFTAPLFTVFIVWANSSPQPNLLVKLILYSLLSSLLLFAVLVLTTTPDKPPKYRFLFCFLGFVVSIAWISTIANEVVGVLKAFGVILGISDAILGLTIFAVGNSLGDLVADITVARLGYPVMALSACFGGPMLNILLGIGVSGLYMTITEADHKYAKHPNKGFKYKPYRIDVSRTLIVSAITLLVTLVGLLIMVPLNKWVMSRRIGWALITLWSVSTVINLAVEISGWGKTASAF